MGDIAVERQGTLESLGDLPDIDFLTVPVDDYFGNYIAELGARGQQEGSGLPMTTSGLEPFLLPRSSADPVNISYGSALPDVAEFGDQNLMLDGLGMQSIHLPVQPPSNAQVRTLSEQRPEAQGDYRHRFVLEGIQGQCV